MAAEQNGKAEFKHEKGRLIETTAESPTQINIVQEGPYKTTKVEENVTFVSGNFGENTERKPANESPPSEAKEKTTEQNDSIKYKTEVNRHLQTEGMEMSEDKKIFNQGLTESSTAIDNAPDISQTKNKTQHDANSGEMKTETKDQKRKALIQELRKIIAKFLQAMEQAPELTTPRESSPVFSKTPLKAFSSSDAVTYETFRTSGGVRCIILAVKKYIEVSAVVDLGCQALTTVSFFDTSSIDDMLMAGVIELAVSLVQHSSDFTEDTKVSMLKLLRTLTQTEDNRERIWKTNGVEAIVKLMKQSETEGRTLSHAALLLSNLTFGNKEIKEAVGKLGGIAAIAKGMGDHKELQAMQARGSLALRNLCFTSDGNQETAGQSGAIEALVGAVHSHGHDREIVHQSCVALVNLSNEKAENRKRIVAAGGVPAVIQLIRRYKESTTVHDDCLAILRNVATESPQAQEEVGDNGGIALIVQALYRFKREEKLCEKACAALRYLCFRPQNRERVGAEKGLEAMVNAVKIHRGSAPVVEHALLAIGNATFENEVNKVAIGECGGMTAIVHAIEQHRLNAIVQEHGCRVMRNLVAESISNAKHAVDAGGITAAVFAMIGYAENASVQEQAGAMLLNLSKCDGVKEKFDQADVKRLAEKALSNHPKHRGVQLQAGMLIDWMNGYELLTPKNANTRHEDHGTVDDRVQSSRSVGGNSTWGSRLFGWPFGKR